MSVKAARRALLWKGGTLVERHVLLVIGIEGDKDTDWVDTLTLAELADEVGVHRATVARTVRHLAEIGALEHEGSGGRNPSRYRVAGKDYQPPPPALPNRRRTVAPRATVNRRSTVAEQSPNRRSDDNAPSYRDRDRDRGKPPLTPPPSAGVTKPEVLPIPAPNGAGEELAKGLDLDSLIAEVRAQRQPPLTRAQAVQARRQARDALEAGWDPRIIVAALVACSAFTNGAFTFAVDQLRRQVVGDPKQRLTKFEQAQMRRRT